MGRIDAIEGIGPVYARTLRKARVRTTEALLRHAGDSDGRKALSSRTGLEEQLVLEWVNRADLMRVKGVGEEYSDLLEAAGVDTVKELRNRNPETLLVKMTQVNNRQKLVRRLPTESMVRRWVEHAQQLPPAVSH